MPWQANNNTMGAMRMPSQVAHQQGKDDAKDRVTVTLTILEAERCLPDSDPTSQVAFVSKGIPALEPFLSEASTRPCFMHAREHAVCVLRVRSHDSLPLGSGSAAPAHTDTLATKPPAGLAVGNGTGASTSAGADDGDGTGAGPDGTANSTALRMKAGSDGCIALTELQRTNFKVCAGATEEWSVYNMFVDGSKSGAGDDSNVACYHRDPALADVLVEARPRHRRTSAHKLRVHAGKLAAQLARHTFGFVLSVNELVMFRLDKQCILADCATGGADRDRSGEDSDHDSGDGDGDDGGGDGDSADDEAGIMIVVRVLEVRPEEEADAEAEEAAEITTGDEAHGEAAGSATAASEQPPSTFAPSMDLHRGRVEAESKFYVQRDDSFGTSAAVFELVDADAWPEAPRRAGMVDVTTTMDDEYFPVNRKLLRPCIALTSAVMAGAGVHSDAVPKANVPMDCCTFDRVLLYLEAQARGGVAAQQFSFSAEHLDAMLEAARALKLRGLEDLCLRKMGEFESRVRTDPIPWAEVVARNTQGEALLVMDGMVLDVTRWLDEHPGGSVIIPEQALNVDSTVFFELYHASRQSFRYLREFYIGEIGAAERHIVPSPPESPSDAFVEQLRQWTTWRVSAQDKVHKSF